MARNCFPDGLIKLKQQQIHTFNRLALQSAAGTAELRSELTRLSCLIGSHPHWQGEPMTGRARSELHHQAAAAPGGEPELVVEYRDGAFTVHTPAARRPSS
ncbi:hypothetical protein [Streptomyces sp. DSM 40907]|uniref:hypothetical protein n=1 Tax=Streptomyces kutzneri TaxID=3051179 RepID=UPI0028CFF0D4|nr:hypothetical protein [Streptomyces sp. DSM 40907]